MDSSKEEQIQETHRLELEMTPRNRTEAFPERRERVENLSMPDLETLQDDNGPRSYLQDDNVVVRRQSAMSRITLGLVILTVVFGGILVFIFTKFGPEPLSLPHDFSNGSTNLGTGNKNPQTESPKLLGFVGVQTSFFSADRRAALRSTWFPSRWDAHLRLEQATGLAFRFVIGRSKDAKKMADLEKEIKRYSGFLLIDVEEEYVNLPNKTLAFFKAAYHHFKADYYVKADDNIYLRPDRLATLLAVERADPMTYIGCMKRVGVIIDLQMKWFERLRHPANQDLFCGYDSIYVLSEEIVAALAVARNNSLRMFSKEDISVGIWMLAMNVNHEDNQGLCDPQCTPASIAVWDFPGCSGLCNPVNRLKELHKISMCSKSPTLPSDDR